MLPILWHVLSQGAHLKPGQQGSPVVQWSPSSPQFLSVVSKKCQHEITVNIFVAKQFLTIQLQDE